MGSQVLTDGLETLAQLVHEVILDLWVKWDFPANLDLRADQEQLVIPDSQDSLVR